MDLAVVKITHVDSLLMLALLSILVLDPVLDHVVEREDVPCVVGLGLDLTLGAVLERRLCEIDGILFICRAEVDHLVVHAGGARRRAPLALGLVVHGAMRDRREHALSGV